jgi:hypothetical protein
MFLLVGAWSDEVRGRSPRPRGLGIIEVGSEISLSGSSIVRNAGLIAVTGSVPPAIGGRAQPSL